LCDDLDVTLILIALVAIPFFVGLFIGNMLVPVSERPISQFELQLLSRNVTIIDSKLDFNNTIEIDAQNFLNKITTYNATEVYRELKTQWLSNLTKYYFVPSNEKFVYMTYGNLEGKEE